ncbi:MAG: MFS transporter, partial [Clostridiales bacterium]|nr:MFS transporter [Clostridiales bacterium]
MTKGKSVYFFIMTMMFWYATCTFNPIISPYAAELNATGVMIGLIGGAYGISQTVLRIPLGFLSDKTDKRKIFILIGTLCSGIAGLIVVLFRSPMSLFLCRIMTGVQAATWVQLTVLYSSMCKPEEAGKAMALMVTACSAGKMLASLTGGFASELYGYTAPFWMMIPACVIAFVMCFGLKDVKLRRTTDKIRISELLKRSFQR